MGSVKMRFWASWLLRVRLFEALRAIPADFRTRNGHLHIKIPRNLLLQLFVQPALELAHFPAAQARHMNVVAGTMRLVVVPVAAQMQQVQLFNQAMFFEEFNRAL